MTGKTELLGATELDTNINDFVKRMKLKTPAALLAAANFVLEQADKGIPVDEGKLANSAFAEPLPTMGDEFGVIFGYSANYAAFVHEMPNDTNWSKSGTESQWLLKTLQREQSSVLNIIRDISRDELNNPFKKGIPKR